MLCLISIWKMHKHFELFTIFSATGHFINNLSFQQEF